MARGICVGVGVWRSGFFLGLGAGSVWGWYVIMYSESSEASTPVSLLYIGFFDIWTALRNYRCANSQSMS